MIKRPTNLADVPHPDAPPQQTFGTLFAAGGTSAQTPSRFATGSTCEGAGAKRYRLWRSVIGQRNKSRQISVGNFRADGRKHQLNLIDFPSLDRDIKTCWH